MDNIDDVMNYLTHKLGSYVYPVIPQRHQSATAYTLLGSAAALYGTKKY